MSGSTKLERLLNLTALLLETPRPLTAEEIHTRVPHYPEDKESFRRSFERDKEDLREKGVPIDVEEVPGIDPPLDGYRIRKDRYYLRDPGLEVEELAALHLAASAVQLVGLEGTGALWKLGGAVSSAATGVAETDVAVPAAPNLVELFEAVSERRPVTFSYRGTGRTVDPYRLDFARGRWYVTGYDHLRGEERHFRLDRIDGAVALGRPRGFERPSTEVPGVRLQPWQLGEAEPVTARLLVDADQAPMAETTVGSEAVIERRHDGSVVLALEVTNVAGLRSFVLGFLEHAEVLEPPEVRAEVVAWLHALADPRQ